MKHYLFPLLLVMISISSIHAQNFWEPTNGPDGRNIYSLAIGPNGFIYAGTADSGIYRSTDDGDSWFQVSPKKTINTLQIYCITVSSKGVVMAGCHNYNGHDSVFILVSLDSGTTWTIHYNLSEKHNQTDIYCVSFDSTGTAYIGTTYGIFFSTNNGNEWVKTNWPTQRAFLTATSGTTLYTCADSRNGLYRSDDGGYNWDQVLDTCSFDWASFVITPKGEIFAGSSYYRLGLFHSVDGYSFSRIGLTNYQTYALAVNSAGHLFWAQSGPHVFRSIDNGKSWTDIGSGLNRQVISCLAVSPVTGYIYAGVGTGVYRSVEPTISVIETTNNRTAISLEPNYPNPFNDETTIRFVLSEPPVAPFIVYDMLGNEIERFSIDHVGLQEVKFHPSHLAAGLYRYVVRTAHSSESGTIVYLK